MEMKVIKCPNCGANAKNHTNCEYCGSLLVRFAEKGIDISNTSYKSDVDILPDLVYNLQKNLKIQKELKGEPVETQIFWWNKDSKWSECDGWDSLKIASPNSYFDNGSQINTEEAVALILVLNIPLIENEIDTSKNAFNEKGKKLIEEFKQLASYPLFQSQMSEYFSDNGVKWNILEYYINFGNDVKGAARLTSEILVKLYDINRYHINTNEGNAIEEAKEDFLSENGFNDENSENIDNESDYSEDQEENSIESLSNWQKVLLVLSGIFVIVGSYYYLNIRKGDLNLGLFCGILMSVFSIILALLPSKHYPAIIEKGLLYKEFFNEDPYSEAFKEDVAFYKKIVTIVGFIISCIIFIFSSPILTFSDDNQKQEQVEAIGSQSSENNNPQKSKLEEIRELGYNDGVKFGYSDGGEALRYYVQMGKTLDQGLDHIQSVIARTAYKEDYGDNISESLLDEYCKQFIEGYKSIVIKK